MKVTNGAAGLFGIPKLTTWPLLVACVIISILIVLNFSRSAPGRACISIREDEIASEAMGINTTKYKNDCVCHRSCTCQSCRCIICIKFLCHKTRLVYLGKICRCTDFCSLWWNGKLYRIHFIRNCYWLYQYVFTVFLRYSYDSLWGCFGSYHGI